MQEKNGKFNLIDEPWIPVVDVGRVGLRQIFEDPELRALGGNPIQKIAVMKLLQAIAMRAAPVSDREEWARMGPNGMSEICLSYLEKWHDAFYLYGDRPFLQMPGIEHAKLISYGTVLPDIATGNTTVLTELQMERELDDGERALLLVFLMGFAFGGKKVDNSIVLTPGYSGKSKSAAPGPSLGIRGFLHSFLLGDSIRQTIWLNLFTQMEIQSFGLFSSDIGIPPWEKMPKGEGCEVAEELKNSLIGRLVPLSRFCLLKEEGLHYTEGVQHLNYLDGIYDPSIAIDTSGRKIKALWADPEKRPWRQLPSLLGFILYEKGQFDCFQLRVSLPQARKYLEKFGIWAGGLKVSNNAGEQYVSGSDDFVESEIWLSSKEIGSEWFNNLKTEMDVLEKIATMLYASIMAYFNTMNCDAGSSKAGQGTSLFWELCEKDFQELVDACAAGPNTSMLLSDLRKRFVARASSIFDRMCPKETARQMEAWALSRPNFGKFLKGEG